MSYECLNVNATHQDALEGMFKGPVLYYMRYGRCFRHHRQASGSVFCILQVKIIMMKSNSEVKIIIFM